MEEGGRMEGGGGRRREEGGGGKEGGGGEGMRRIRVEGRRGEEDDEWEGGKIDWYMETRQLEMIPMGNMIVILLV